MINAVIFDMDGVLADTQKTHARIESELLAQKGVIITPDEITRRFAGVRSSVWIPQFMDENNASGASDIISRLYPLILAEAKSGVNEVPGAINLVKKLYGAGFRLGVASSSRLEYIGLVMSSLGLSDYFGTLTSAREVENGKPSPDVFLLAAKRLSSSSYESLVIEDGLSGMIGAYDGVFACIGLDPEGLLDVPSNTFRIKSLGEITLDLVANIHDYVKIKK